MLTHWVFFRFFQGVKEALAIVSESGVEQTLGRFVFSSTTGVVLQAETLGRFVDSDTTGRFKP